MSEPYPAALQQFEQVQTLIERTTLPMVATEGQAHAVRLVNPAFCALVGQAAGAIVGRRLEALLCESREAPDAAAAGLLDLVYASGAAEFAVPMQRVSDAGGAVQMPCAVWPILDGAGRSRGLLVQVSAPSGLLAGQSEVGQADELRDVNKRLLVAGLQAQEQAEVQISLRAAAEAAISSRDEFISIAAHELRTPVTSIKLRAELARHMLKDGAPDVQRLDRYLSSIVSGADRVVMLINDLMDASRVRSGLLLLHLEPVDLVALVGAVVQRYAETVGGQHQLSMEVPSEPLVVEGDAVRLEQIVDNLVGNAIKYSPGERGIDVQLRPAGDGVQLTVRDAGIGLPPGAQDYLFEPFGRAPNATHQKIPGMGLGLHICRQIAEAHGGRTWIESRGEGLGTTVGVWLPRSQPAEYR